MKQPRVNSTVDQFPGRVSRLARPGVFCQTKFLDNRFHGANAFSSYKLQKLPRL